MSGSHRAGRADRRADPPGADEPTELIPRAAADPGAAAPTERIADEPIEPDRPQRSTPTLMEQMGGISGIVYSTIPIAVFILVNLVTELRTALIAALATGVAIAVVRLVRREALQPAISGLIGVGVCAFLANRTGQARDFYLPGLLYSAAFGLAFLVSVVVRWPLAGVIWHGINGEGQSWRRNPRMMRAYTWASLLWALVFGARLVVQGWLYNVDEANWLGVARLAMGYPLIGVALLGTVLAVRRAQRTAAPGEA